MPVRTRHRHVYRQETPGSVFKERDPKLSDRLE